LTPWEQGVRTPIMIRWPGRVTPKRDDVQLASNIDIPSTILAAAGLPVPDGMEGIDLLNETAVAKRDCVFIEDFEHDMAAPDKPEATIEARGVICGDWKLVVTYKDSKAADLKCVDQVLLFDLKNDPKEKHNLAAKHKGMIARLMAKLDGWWKPKVAPGPGVAVIPTAPVTKSLTFKDAGFVDPADEYGPRTWWHWLNENISKSGITKDLEAMKTMGYKGAHMVNLPQGGPNAVVGEDVFGSPIWMEKVEHAAKECQRLGLELSFGSCVGWVAGGPWIPAELSMQDIVWRHKFVKGPVSGSVQLPQPTKNRGYYRDIAVLAYPTLPGEAQPLAALGTKVTSDPPGIDWSAAIDGDADTFVELPNWKPGETSRSIVFEFEKPVTVRSLSLQMHEDSESRLLKLFTGDDGQRWQYLANVHRWMKHFDPRREEMIEGFADRTARFVKLELMAPSPKVDMKLYEVNFLSARLSRLHTKAARQRTRPSVSNPSAQVVPADQLVQMDRILDLTGNLQPDGTLKCTLPAGEWTILRFGHTSNANEIHPASTRASGLETDKLSVEALLYHFENGVVDSVFERLGDLTGTTLVEMNIDSWEANCQTWTKAFPEEFEKRRGYDLRKWLVTLTGRFVGSVDETERFLWDYRRTIGDLLADNFYGAFGAYIRERGLKLSAEAPGIGIPIQCDQIQVQGLMDIPQGEFWLTGPPNPKFPHWPGGQDNTKEAAVAAHVYGKEVVSCEAFTSFGHHDGFTQYPHILKPVGDRQFCKGMNEIVFHRYAHQPDDRVPGMGLGQFGLNLERTTTWWEPGREWITYLRRCQYMLRQGRFFADVCYYYGEDVPGSAYYFAPRALDPRQMMKPVLPKGYDYDVCDRIIFDRMSVEDGEVVLPSGMRYAYLVLPDHARYTPVALEKVQELVEAGASVIGPRPSRCPSLTGYPDADRRIQEIAAELWPDGPGERRVGKGRVIADKSFETILAEDSLGPDFQSGADDVWYIHRRLNDAELYFVAYQEDQTKDLTFTFRVSGMAPEVWNPVNGEKATVTAYTDDGTVTTIPFRMDPYGSRFIIFRPDAGQDSVVKLTRDGQPVCLEGSGLRFAVWENGRYAAEFNDGSKAEVVVDDIPAPETVPGRWTVTFQEERGAPEGQVAFDALTSWTDRTEEGIKYFSGTAIYEKGINVSRERLQAGRRVWLDLGQVNHLAEVSVNDQPLGVLWKSPFRIDITDAAKPGANKVVVKVTNCWKNRILGDLKRPADQRITWTLYPFYHNEPDAPLMESGLLGPVRVLSSGSVVLSLKE